MIEVAVLGPLRVGLGDGDRDRTPSRLKLRQLTGLLALHLNRLVRTEVLEAELWPAGQTPRSASVLHTHTSQVRKSFAPAEGERPATFALRQTRLVGYTLSGPAAAVDCQRFLDDVGAARHDLREGRAQVAAGRLAGALALWRGSVLEDVRHGPVVADWARRLEEVRSEATEELAETLLALGRPRDVVDLLAPVVVRPPVREKMHRTYLLALEQLGRRADAVRAYQAARSLTREHTGVEPGAALQAVYRQLVTSSNGSPDAATWWPPTSTSAPRRPAGPVVSWPASPVSIT